MDGMSTPVFVGLIVLSMPIVFFLGYCIGWILVRLMSSSARHVQACRKPR